MRLIAFVEYAAVLAGILAIVAGKFFALPDAFHLGVFLVGAGLALGGLEGVAARRMPFRASHDAYEAYAGPPALIVGMMALLAGAAIIGSAHLLADGTWHATASRLMRRPAPLLAFAGLLLLGSGVLMLLNPRGRTGWAWTLLVYGPRALAGIVVAAAGLAGIGLGVWEWLDPQAFDRLAREAQRIVRWR